jgi:hypothetical protein
LFLNSAFRFRQQMEMSHPGFDGDFDARAVWPGGRSL